MPKNCSADIRLVAAHLDKVIGRGNTTEIAAMKDMFGMGSYTDDLRFVQMLQRPIQQWQDMNIFLDPRRSFHSFCDYIENVRPIAIGDHGKWASNASADAVRALKSSKGVGLNRALERWATYQREVWLPDVCDYRGVAQDQIDECISGLGRHNSDEYDDIRIKRPYTRQWYWLLCNESLGWWFTRALRGQHRPAIVSRTLQETFFRKTCDLYFPAQLDRNGHRKPAYGWAKGRTPKDVNVWTHGWKNTNTTRLIYVNGEHDGWREASVSSDIRPGGRLHSTKRVPVKVIPDGFHCDDEFTASGKVNAGAKKVIDEVIEQLVEWVDEFYKERR